MKKNIEYLLVLLMLTTNSMAIKNQGAVIDNTTRNISFTENKGQIHDQNYNPRPEVLFGAMTGNMSVHLKTKGVSYQLYRVDSWKEVEDPKSKEMRKEVDQQTIYRLDLNWLNANKYITQSRDEELPGYNNYYLESCPNGALNVKSYKGVTLNNLYNGINLHYYEKNGQLKHDYIVAPYADYKQIQVEVKGAQSVTINKTGTLTFKTPLGTIEEGAPIVYQNGKQLKAKYILNKNVLSFEIENYNSNYELIIDPVTRAWGTYYGGSGQEQGIYLAKDASSNVFLTGYTSSTNGTSIATVGSHQNTFGGGSWDAFLVKLNSSGVRQWATYYGGNGIDYSWSCAADPTGNVYMSGWTDCATSTVIATAGSHQSAFGGGTWDAFLVKFNSAGVRQWGTYYGGSGDDYSYSCSADALGDVYLVGWSQSSTGTVIATPASHQPAYGGGADAYLAKFNSNGVRQWATYYGGTSGEIGYCVNTKVSGIVYLVGYTYSNTGTSVATPGSHQSTNGGSQDAFLVKFTSNGVRLWGTYYGGTGNDFGYSCDVDPFGDVYLAGKTSSSGGTSIATLGSHQSTYGGGSDDPYLVKFNTNGVRQWGTYYGGNIGAIEDCRSCSTDGSGNVYLSGLTAYNTGTVIATPGSYQSTFGGGPWNAFLVQFNASGVRQWGTYYGSTGGESCNACITDGLGSVYIAGNTATGTSTIIASVGSHQTNYGGGPSDAFIAKLSDCVSITPTASVNSSVCVGSSLNFTASVTGTAVPTYSWSGPNSYTSNIQNPVITGAGTVNIGTYTLTVNNGGCVETTVVQVNTVNPSPTITVNSGSICAGNSFTMSPSGANTYTFQGGNAVVSPTSTSNYTVVGTNTLGCTSNIVTSNVIVNPIPTVTAVSNTSLLCIGQSATLTASGANNYTWSPGGGGISIVVSPTTTATYSLTGVDANGCQNTISFTQSVSACTGVNTNASVALSGVEVYPNPTNGILNVVSYTPNENSRVEIYNAIGQLLQIEKIVSTKQQVNISELTNGIYFIKVQRENEFTIKKIIKN